jgi:hypothetical protein
MFDSKPESCPKENCSSHIATSKIIGKLEQASVSMPLMMGMFVLTIGPVSLFSE